LRTMRASYSTSLSRALIFRTGCPIQNASAPATRLRPPYAAKKSLLPSTHLHDSFIVLA
jgi:hypothetical protein